MSLRVTVVDEQTGDTDTVRVPDGDYFIVCADPCRLDHLQMYRSGTVVLTLKSRDAHALPDETRRL